MADATNDAEAHELPPLSTAQRRKIQRCYDHGCALIKEGKKQGYDHDYVNTMFSECVVTDPGNVIYVEAFLDNLADKYQNNKKGGRLGFNARGAVKKAFGKSQWHDVLKLGPDILRQNPWDVQTLRWMAEACAAFHFNEVELRYLKNALDANPKAIEVNKHCAVSLARMGQFEQAIACWHRIEEWDQKNQEAPEMISKLSVERHRIASGIAEDTSPEVREKVKQGSKAGSATNDDADSPEADESPTPKREIKLTERQQLEQAIVNNEADTDAYRALAELHIKEARYQDAEKVLTKALQVTGHDLQLQAKLEDTIILRAKAQLKVAEARAKDKQTETAKDLANEVRQNVYRLELDIYNARAQRFPEDLRVKYELAVRLKKLGNYDEAIELFREARNDRKVKTPATIDMGECLQHLKQYSKALQCYQRAVESADKADQLEQKKIALYRAGVLAAGLKQADVAKTHLNDLLKLEPGYKDAKSRLDKLG